MTLKFVETRTAIVPNVKEVHAAIFTSTNCEKKQLYYIASLISFKPTDANTLAK